MPLPDYSLFGETVFRFKPDKPIRRSREVNGLQGFWQTDAEEYFALGSAPPDYPNMRIIEIDSDLEIEGAAYEQRITCEGILDNSSFIELEREDHSPEEGWDETDLNIFTRTPDDPRWARGGQIVNDDGVIVPGYENMYIQERRKRYHRAKDYYVLELGLKGILEDKIWKRRINGAVTTSSSTFSGLTVLEDNIFLGYPPVEASTASGGGTNITVEYDAATISLTDTFLSSTPPPTEFIGKFWVPPAAPAVSVAVLTSTNFKFFWPFGWKCTSMPCEQLAGTNLWLMSPTFMYQVPKLPIT